MLTAALILACYAFVTVMMAVGPYFAKRNTLL